jgi:zinc D-Ala-D-Ala carboxypeptidase
VLTEIRKECDFPFPISSAYRDATHPAEASKLGVGSHQLGKAVDVLCRGEKALKLIEVAQKHGITRIGVSQRGLSRFIHLDSCTEKDGKPPAIWSY